MVSADAVEAAKYNIKEWTQSDSWLPELNPSFLNPFVEPIKQVAVWLGLSKATDTTSSKKPNTHKNIFKEPATKHLVDFNTQLMQNLKKNISKNVENPYNVIVHKTSVDVTPTSIKYSNEARVMANRIASLLIKSGHSAKVVKTSSGYSVVVEKTVSNKESDEWSKLLRQMLIAQEATKNKANTQKKTTNSNTLFYVAILVAIVVAIAYYLLD